MRAAMMVRKNSARQFSLSCQGQNGQNYVLETSSNLTSRTPDRITAPTNDAIQFINTNATDGDRFYRLKAGPPTP